MIDDPVSTEHLKVLTLTELYRNLNFLRFKTSYGVAAQDHVDVAIDNINQEIQRRKSHG